MVKIFGYATKPSSSQYITKQTKSTTAFVFFHCPKGRTPFSMPVPIFIGREGPWVRSSGEEPVQRTPTEE